MANTSFRLLISFVMLMIISLCAGQAKAQTDPDLLVKPWLTPTEAVDTSTEGTFEAAGHTRETDDTVRISEVHMFGRWRVDPALPATPRLGYDFLYYDIDTHDPALPKHLYDGTVGFAQPFMEMNKWFFVVTGAVGYAGNSLFDDPNAVFATGNIIVGRDWGEDHALLFALNYDGNRTFLPDCPIPAFGYTNRFNPHLKYLLGFPYNSITYRPQDGFELEVGYEVTTTFEARIGYEFVKHFNIFGDYSDRLTPFHIDTFPDDSRMFFETHQLEAGLRWNPTKLIRVSIGGGWAFGQEFSQGWDTRHQMPIRHISDEPFGRVLVEIGF